LRKILLLSLFLPVFAIAQECNFDSNQAEMTRCAISEYGKARDMLERNVGRVEYCLGVNLVQSHEAWKLEEKSRCSRELALGGSIATQLFYACLLEGTNHKIRDIRNKAPTCFK
jgi:uncharacterized protein YecT (DUF1311 family)